MRTRPFAAFALGVLAPLSALAQAPAAAASAPALPPGWTVLDEGAREPEVRRGTVEDDYARIEELRVRGAVRSTTVHPKVGPRRPYEVMPIDAGRQTINGPNESRTQAGQSVWRVLDF